MMGPHVPSTLGNVGKKVFIDLVSFSKTVRKNCYLLTVQDGFTSFASAYPICNKEAGTVDSGKSSHLRTFQHVRSTKPDTLGQQWREVWERNNRTQYFGMLNTTNQSYQGLKLGLGF